MPNTLTDAPQASHILANDQPLMEANNLFYVNTLGKDHQIALGDNDGASFEGRHKQVCYNNRHGNAPILSMIGDGTNALTYADNGNLFLDSATLAGPYQLTTVNASLSASLFGAFGNTSTTTPVNGAVQCNNAGWSFLPGGLIFQYGTNPTPGNGTFSINFPVTFPTKCSQLFITGLRNSSNVDQIYQVSKSQGSFSYRTTTSNVGFTSFDWFAIGN